MLVSLVGFGYQVGVIRCKFTFKCILSLQGPSSLQMLSLERESECVCAYVCVFLFAGRALLDIALHTVDVL